MNRQLSEKFKQVAAISIVLGAGVLSIAQGCDEPLPNREVGTIVSEVSDGLYADKHTPMYAIYAGLSPDTHKPMYATPEDAPWVMNHRSAVDYCAQRAGGHNGWRLPSSTELNVLFQNRNKGALKGTFNLTGSEPAGYYWSSTPYYAHGAYGQRFSGGNRDYTNRYVDSSVRCVRG